MKKIIAALGLLLTLAACASNSYVAPVAADRKATIKTIGVASIVGDKMYFTRIGITIFDTERTSGDTSAWGIDEGVTQALTARLKDRYSIVPIAIDRTAAINFEANKGMAAQEVVYNAITPPATPVDAYLVLVPTESRDFISNSRFTLDGLGIFRSPGFGIQVYAACDLYLIDAKTKALIGGGQLGFAIDNVSAVDFLKPYNLGAAMRGAELAHRRVEDKLAQAKDWPAFTPEQLDKVKAGIMSLLNDSLDYPLKGIGLVQ